MHPPKGWHRIGWRPLRWAQRLTIAEEHQWRAQAGHGSGWIGSNEQVRGAAPSGAADTSSSQAPIIESSVERVAAELVPVRTPAFPPWPPEEPGPLGAEQIAALYRQLRKGREDSKDEPGANDFYYGEMEMRRRSGSRGERSILWAYWLVSGYGLRASRALFAFVVTIFVLGAIPLALWGFPAAHPHPHHPYGRALLFALDSSISLLRAPTTTLTAGGQVIQIFLRLAGPLFFGLALLALRGRVKR
jgi:hypothetical protein